MRISDWSSDVCSSDLSECERGRPWRRWRARRETAGPSLRSPQRREERASSPSGGVVRLYRTKWKRRNAEPRADRKSVVEGKRESVRVDLGGSRHINKNKRKQLSQWRNNKNRYS